MKAVSLFVSFILAFLIVAPLAAQPIMQKGVAYRYNGKNKRMPIGGVYIKAVTSDNGVVSNEQSGAFELALNNLKMGSRIGNVRVTKQGMMIFNQQAVDEWSVRKDPLCLILCNADEFQKQKKNLIAIGESQAKKKYDKKLAELKRQNEAQQLQLDDYYNKLDSLEKEYQNALKHMDEYADVFARIDESEVDTVAQRAIELFNRGEIEESIHLLEQQNYLEKIVQANRTIEQADELISTAEQAKELAEQDKQKYLEGIKAQIAGYKLQNEWGKAKELLKGLADNLNTLETMWDYIVFCYNQNDYNEAEDYCISIQCLLEKDTALKNVEQERLWVKNNLGVLYYKTGRYIESEKMHKSALIICESLSKENPSAFEDDLAAAQLNLGNVYCATQRYREGELMYKSALEIYNRLAKDDPSSFEVYLAMIQRNLAGLYSDTQRYSESETMYKSALEIYERLAEDNPSAFEPGLASTQMGLGKLYWMINRYSECETMYKSALEIYERLAEDNPSTFEPAVALIRMNIGALCHRTLRYSESEEMYKSALEVYERLTKNNPSAFEPSCSMIRNNLGLLYYSINRYSESEAMLKSALEIRERLAEDNPSVFTADLAITQMNFARLYLNTQRYVESETMFKHALELFEHLAKDNPSAFENYLAYTQSLFGDLYYEVQCYSECETLYKACLVTYSRLYEQYPQLYEEDLISCFNSLGCTYLNLEKNSEAKENFKQALSLTHRAIQNGREIASYEGTLFYLISIASSEKDYESGNAYNMELLPLLKSKYETEPEAWKAVYSGHLVSQSFYSNLLGKFKEGEQYAWEALKVDSTQHVAYTNLAAALLFQGRVEEAEKLYMQYKAEFKDSFLDDFAEYERLGVIPEERKKDVERIKAMLNEP